MKCHQTTICETVHHGLPNEFFNRIPGAFFVINMNGRILDCNEGACDMFGYLKSEMLLLGSRDLLAGGGNHKFPDVHTGSISSSVWLTCQKKNGRVFPGLCRNRIVSVSGQQFALFIIVDSTASHCEPHKKAENKPQSRDTAKTKEVETLFKESEKRRMLAMEAASEGVWEWDITSGVIITCPSYFGMLGFDPRDVTAPSGPEVVTSYETFLDLVYKDDKNKVVQQLHRCISCKQIKCEMEMRLKTKTGGWKWILKRGEVVDWDEHGNPVRMIGTHIDINERRMTKEALVQSKERLKAQYMGHPLPTYTWQMVDNHMVLTDYNTAAHAFTNGQVKGFMGLKASILYKENREIFEAITKAFHHRTVCKAQTLYRMFTTGDERYITFTCSYVTPDMVLVYMEDITGQRLAEQRLQQSRKDLQRLTAQLINSDENVRKSIAQELHDSVGQYLTSIKYVAEKSVDRAAAGCPDSKKDFSLNKLVGLVQTTIDEVSRIAMDLRPSTLDDLGIIATVSWFCRNYHSVYPSIEVVQQIKIDENDIPRAIKIHLFRILQESLNNVARHSRATKIHVCLSRTGNAVEMAIADNGIGFNVQKRIHVDQKGRRGFGLFSMQERIKHLGGEFSIVSAPGKGTTIRALWPCA